MAVKIAVLVVYAVMIVSVGVQGLRRTRTFSDFFLGGGAMGPWMSAFTYATAYFSAVLFIGFAGKIGWGFGLSGLWIALFNALVGVLFVWGVLGPRIKTMSVDYGVHTMAEFFEVRYGSRFLKLFSALAIFVFFVPYTAAVFMGLSYLFETNFHMQFLPALLLMGGFTAVYLVLGGYKSMGMIDVAFGMIMIGGVAVLMGFTLHEGGGFAAIAAQLREIDPALASPVGPPGFWPLFCLVFLTSVAPLAMPQLVQKFYAIRDRRAIRVGMVASTAFALLIGGVAYFAGATTRIFPGVAATAAGPDGAVAFDKLMPTLLAEVVPEALSVLMLLLILSASMSTLAALVLIASSSVVKDLYAGFVARDVPDARLTLLMRVTSAVFVLISVVLAAFKPATIVAVLGISWGAIGAVFLGPFLWGLFTGWSTREGAVAGSVLGLAVCLGLYVQGRPSPEAGTLGMMTSLAVVPLVSLAFRLRGGRA